MICSFCDQGRVYRVRLSALNQIGFLCEECDALWFHKSEIGGDTYVVSEAHPQSDGRPGLWSEVEILEKDISPQKRTATGQMEPGGERAADREIRGRSSSGVMFLARTETGRDHHGGRRSRFEGVEGSHAQAGLLPRLGWGSRRNLLTSL